MSGGGAVLASAPIIVDQAARMHTSSWQLPRAMRLVLALALLVTSCIPQPRPRPGPRPYAAAPPAPEDPRLLRQCLADLSQLGAQVEALPDRIYPNGCSATGAVKLVAVGIPITNLGALKCGLALSFVRWMREAVPAAAVQWFGSDVVRIESFGSFACRPINNVAGNRLSEHGRANAVDIAAFILRDGRRVTVLADWNGPDERARGFLRAVHAAACRRFSVVLGPDANALHRDHLHFDMGNGRYCR